MQVTASPRISLRAAAATARRLTRQRNASVAIVVVAHHSTPRAYNALQSFQKVVLPVSANGPARAHKPPPGTNLYQLRFDGTFARRRDCLEIVAADGGAGAADVVAAAFTIPIHTSPWIYYTGLLFQHEAFPRRFQLENSPGVVVDCVGVDVYLLDSDARGSLLFRDSGCLDEKWRWLQLTLAGKWAAWKAKEAELFPKRRRVALAMQLSTILHLFDKPPM